MGNSQDEQTLGLAYKQQGRWGDAAQAFERAIAGDPDHAAAYFELADLSQTLGQIDAAINFFLRTINLDHADSGCDLDYIPKVARPMKIDYALSNSFGFGGTNGCLIFKRYAA